MNLELLGYDCYKVYRDSPRKMSDRPAMLFMIHRKCPALGSQAGDSRFHNIKMFCNVLRPLLFEKDFYVVALNRSISPEDLVDQIVGNLEVFVIDQLGQITTTMPVELR